eukprot:Rhum_TRINITY_DN6784_c0_g1::Rhum_TRINITY_DN6784_c0_g1_i1::g.20765::m.20765
MNIDDGMRHLRVDDEKLKKRSKKMLKKLGNFHGSAPLPCQAAAEMACVYLAARVEGRLLDKVSGAAASRWGGCSESDFYRTATAIQHLLRLRFKQAAGLNLKELCAEYEEKTDGSMPAGYLAEEVRDILGLFMQRRPQASLADVHTAAAFQLMWHRDALPKFRHLVSEKEMATLCATDTGRYRDVLALLKAALPEVAEAAEEAASAARRRPAPGGAAPPSKRRRMYKASGGGDAAAAAEGVGTWEQRREERVVEPLKEVIVPEALPKQSRVTDYFRTE